MTYLEPHRRFGNKLPGTWNCSKIYLQFEATMSNTSYIRMSMCAVRVTEYATLLKILPFSARVTFLCRAGCVLR